MKVRIIELEGTPEELAESPYLRHIASHEVPIEPPRTEEGDRANRGALAMYPEVVASLERSPRPPRGESRALIERFLAEVLGWPDVEARLGKSSRTDDGQTRYLRLHRRGSQLGAFAYVYPARMSVRTRLNHLDIKGRKYAQKRNVRTDGDNVNPYQVRIDLRDSDAVKEAIELAKLAYDRQLG